MPEDYGDAKAFAQSMSRAFHEELAKAFAPRINGELKTKPQRTLAQCRELAMFCNTELEDLHLAIRCPGTNINGSLSADISSQEFDAPRFRIRAHGGRVTHTSRDLPKLEVMECTRRQFVPRFPGSPGSDRER
jgi:hypothetical protein